MSRDGRVTRGLWKKLLAAAAVATALIGAAVTTEAASARCEVNSDGILVIYDTAGKEVKRFSAGPGAHFDTRTAGNGNYVAFSRYASGSSGKSKCTIYRYDVSNGKVASADLPSGFFSYDVDLYYGDSIYLTGWNPSDNAVGYRFYPEKVQMEKIADGGVEHQYKNWLVLDSTRVHGAFVPYKVYVYNINTKAVKTACKKAAAYTVSGKYIYAAVLKKNTYTPELGATYKIIRYDMVKGKTKTLVKTMKGYYVDRVTSKYVYSRKSKSGKTTYYRYSIKTKKTKRMSAGSYKKAAKLQ